LNQDKNNGKKHKALKYIFREATRKSTKEGREMKGVSPIRKRAYGAYVLSMILVWAYLVMSPQNNVIAQEGDVSICHKPLTGEEKDQAVPRGAVDSHLGHGDCIGSCSDINTDLSTCEALNSKCHYTCGETAARCYSQCSTEGCQAKCSKAWEGCTRGCKSTRACCQTNIGVVTPKSCNNTCF
jgi:hypothetical protein